MADYVHYHNVRFQIIYCYKGWVRVVYEDQGTPFVLQAGDCVLQPPRIRHRVIESSPGLEVIEIASPAEHETFAGIAGVGDLTATILAEGSRNRRAGELLGEGTPADQIPGIIGQASEALDSVPLIAEAVRKAGMDCSSLDALAELIAGDISPAEWMSRVRQAERARREPAVGGRAA